MRKCKIVALMTACVVMLTGCSLVRIDEEKVANRVVATVNGVDIYRYEVNDDVVESYVQQMIQIYESMGSSVDDEQQAEIYTDYQKTALDTLVLTEVFAQKAVELGIVLTDEEKQDCQTQSDEMFASQKDSVRAEVESEVLASMATEDASDTAADDTYIEEDADASDTEAADEETEFTDAQQLYIDEETELRYQEAIEMFPYTPETYYDYLCEQALNMKVEEYIDGLATVTDEDTQGWYDETLAMQQEEMDADAQAFADVINSGYIYTYVPEDTVAVKQILLAFDDDLKAQAQALYDEDDIDGMMALVQDAVDELEPTALDLKQQLEDGADIDALIEEYNDDPGMTTTPGSKVGYLVESRTSTYIPAFSEAALALMTVGAVSEPIVTYNGVHILQSIKVYKKGVVSYEDLHDDIKEALLPTKQEEKYNEITQQWLDEADIVYHYDRLTTPTI